MQNLLLGERAVLMNPVNSREHLQKQDGEERQSIQQVRTLLLKLYRFLDLQSHHFHKRRNTHIIIPYHAPE